MASLANDASRNDAELKTCDNSSNNETTTDELIHNPDIQKQVAFAKKEKDRRRRNNKIYQEKRKFLNVETIAQRTKRVALETATELKKVITIPFESLLENEISRILKFDVDNRIQESKAKFRWVSPLGSDTKTILQFEVSCGIFVDFLYTKKSNFPNSGYGLFAARSLPKGLTFSIYLGRLVKFNDIKRKYIMQLTSRFVKKKNGKEQWEKIKYDRPKLIVDALMSDRFNIWTTKREIFLGAHLMNDPDFKSQKKNKNEDEDDSKEMGNCIVQPLLEVVTATDIAIDDELTINYNRA